MTAFNPFSSFARLAWLAILSILSACTTHLPSDQTHHTPNPHRRYSQPKPTLSAHNFRQVMASADDQAWQEQTQECQKRP